MRAIITYEQNGITIPMLNGQEFAFTTIRGAKASFRNRVERNINNGNLRRFYGTAAHVTAKAFVVGNDTHFLSMKVQPV